MTAPEIDPLTEVIYGAVLFNTDDLPDDLDEGAAAAAEAVRAHLAEAGEMTHADVLRYEGQATERGKIGGWLWKHGHHALSEAIHREEHLGGTPPRFWPLTYEAKTLTANASGGKHWAAKAQAVVEWRTAFWVLARESKVPRLARISIEVQPETKTAQLPDTDASAPAAKAALDGIVDAGVVDDDGPRFVRSVRLLAPVHTGRNAVTVTVFEEPS